MLFSKKQKLFSFDAPPITGIRVKITEIFNNRDEQKLLKREKIPQLCREDGEWEDIYSFYERPIYLEDNNG